MSKLTIFLVQILNQRPKTCKIYLKVNIISVIWLLIGIMKNENQVLAKPLNLVFVRADGKNLPRRHGQRQRGLKKLKVSDAISIKN